MANFVSTVSVTLCAGLCLAATGARAGVETNSITVRTASALEEIVRAGAPLILVEKDGDYSWRTLSDADGVRSLRIGTDKLAEIHRFWKGGTRRPKDSAWPVLQTTVEWDTASGTYTLKRLELGFFGKRVWLIHELREADERYGTIGVQIKMEW
jgi:hypothetical protein